ncbi:MAG: magnesium-translocating P-type ATPase [Lachnospiraceae bacterium]|nr:magnesium-translocating P-type ATPase [Lachnospiraceae bacterium]
MPKSTLLNSRMKKYAYRDTSEIYQDIPTSPEGLSLEQVEAMREQYGENQLTRRKNDTLWYRLRRAFVNPFTIILFVLAAVSLITDVWLVSDFSRNITSVVIICVMILISGTIRLVQELRAKNASDQLERLIHASVTVKREGVLIDIPAESLVVGDLVFLSPGDRIPADLRLIKTQDLFISQAAITGESAILEKDSRTCRYQEQLSMSQLTNLAFMATTVISGKGEGIVLAVGKDTLYGNFIRPDSDGSTAFQKGANSIAWVMLRFMIILVPIVFLVSGITRGDWVESFVFALSVAVGLTPEMLPMVITACLAKGSLSLSKKQTIVKNINAMQGFGSMDVLCMDKTGTLTNESILLEYYMDVLGNENEKTLQFAYLNSFYHSGVRNPIDNAILACRTMAKQEAVYDALVNRFQKADEIPFDYSRKFVSTLVGDEHGMHELIVKGDIEQIFSHCSFVEYQGKVLPIENSGFENVTAIVDEMLEDGMKVIAIAHKSLGRQDHIVLADEKDLTLMGYLAFFDAPKKSAADSVQTLKKLQVRSKILTGDRAEIAVSICRRVGISVDWVLTGSQINQLSDEHLCSMVEQADVFAELAPGQKVRILNALQENGHTVGFLGDGMNDIPAISEADVGISVDTAVDAAKDIADVVLLQKDLTVLEQGILEGRKTFSNMLKYIKITASSNFGNMLSIVCASAVLPFLPMTAIQLLLLNLLYDALCIILPWDNVDAEDMVTPRAWSGKTLGRFMCAFGPISSIFDILTFLFLYFMLCPALCGGMTYTQLADPVMQAQYIAIFQTGWFLESMWTQVLILQLLRTRKITFLQSRASSPVLLITLAGIIAFTFLTMTPFAAVLGLTRLPLAYFGFLLLMVVFYMLLTSVAKGLYQGRYHELL